MLKNRKYVVTKAMDGVQALKLLEERKRAQSYMPDIILLVREMAMLMIG